MAVELAEYLIADEFIGEWTRASGYLPTRPSSIDGQDPTIAALVESAKPIPSNDVLSVLGQLMQDALIRVLNGERPAVVAASVVDSLNEQCADLLNQTQAHNIQKPIIRIPIRNLAPNAQPQPII